VYHLLGGLVLETLPVEPLPDARICLERILADLPHRAAFHVERARAFPVIAEFLGTRGPVVLERYTPSRLPLCHSRLNADKNCALLICVYPRSSAAQKTFGRD
jgi:hypothetical protein